ncbi:helix-turn-helix domain-containing protein [Caloramator quimbayensis]|nr:helix-turn-helix transcriptional regulator [Caloramator quimbayensis]
MKWRLKEQIDKNGDTLEELANYLEITYQTLSKKMNEHVDFTRTEIKKIKSRYNLTAEQIEYIFFTD